MSEANQNRDTVAFADHFERGRMMMLWPTLLGCTVLIVASPLILRVFGPEFTSGSVPVAILSIGILIQAAAGPIQERMVVLNQQRAVAMIVAGSLLFNVAASIALTIMLGLAGTALASAISIALRVGLMRHFAHSEPAESSL
jgi:O-antigen/teichoic acid export membrane protein